MRITIGLIFGVLILNGCATAELHYGPASKNALHDYRRCVIEGSKYYSRSGESISDVLVISHKKCAPARGAYEDALKKDTAKEMKPLYAINAVRGALEDADAGIDVASKEAIIELKADLATKNK